jgi:hypothetical protein
VVDSPITVVDSHVVVVVGNLVLVALDTVEVDSLEPVDIDLLADHMPWEAAGVDSPVVEVDSAVVVEVDSLELVGILHFKVCTPIGLVEVAASEGTQLVDRNSIAFLILNYNKYLRLIY